MYWEQQPDVRNEAVSAAMPRKKSEDLLRYFHVSDRNELKDVVYIRHQQKPSSPDDSH